MVGDTFLLFKTNTRIFLRILNREAYTYNSSTMKRKVCDIRFHTVQMYENVGKIFLRNMLLE